MKQMKKVEIIIESIQMKRVIVLLASIDLPGYTIIPDVGGSGLSGRHDLEELTDVSRNSYIILVCTYKKAEEVIAKMTPVIQTFGGVCFTSKVEKIERQS